MVFNSLVFFVFFPLVVGLYFSLPHRFRWAWLLAASCGFYAWLVPAYLLLLGFIIVVDYLAGLGIERAAGARRRLILSFSIAANVAVLGCFKYFNFIDENIAALARQIGWDYVLHPFTWALPIGLSFHTFQAMSYTIEVYRGRQKAERHLGLYALYVMFFPQLVAGPIERPQNLLPQFRTPQSFDYDNVTTGLRLMAWGLFKKVVVADRLGIFVDAVYGAPQSATGPAIVAAAAAFAFQIYCDFSGYSDVAVGAARVLGIRLMTNFARPFLARSVGEFWRRWHISLTSWFKDYVYTPLRTNQAWPASKYTALLAVFLLSGLWHGASWNFVLWGAANGLVVAAAWATSAARTRAAARLGLDHYPRLLAMVQIGATFSVVSAGFAIFRLESLAQGRVMLTQLAQGWSAGTAAFTQAGLASAAHAALPGLLALLVVLFADWKKERDPAVDLLAARPVWQRWSVYYAGVAALLLLFAENSAPFIYFQF